ncbi:putative MFS family arabinose efflux permease [Scopulibacillus darangshiensis]|uniref:Putative MFS family arabinose efflux permease n=1 Tax=Scopulibacillus darangshiensis TaxID=442528 RepID=A0A4R2P477_9BACL|nr:MFS transporter [Scopulibacillus darangshiensis]TCP28948.1 putative MFS family arabinose efflux permease [Scopulibacillus darangshiensis]
MDILSKSKLRPLAEHNANILFWATMFGRISFLEPVLVLFYFERGLNAGHIFALLLCFSISVLIFEVPTGAFADRFGPKLSFIIGSAINIVSKVLLLFAFDPWLFYLSRLLDGLSATFFSGSDEALIYESLKETNQQDKMSNIWGKIESAAFIPMIVSFVLGGVLAKDLLDWQFMLLISFGVAFHLIQFVILFRIETPKGSGGCRDHPFKHVSRGIRIIKRQPDLIRLFLNFTVVMIPTFVFAKFDQPYLTDAGLPVAWLGVIYAAGALISLILSRNIGRLEKLFPRPVILVGNGLFVAAALAAGAFFLNHLILAMLVLTIVKTSTAIRYPVYSQMTNDYIPSGSRATTISLLSVMDSVLDIVIFGLLSVTAGLGLRAIFIGCAVIILIGSVIPIREKAVIPYNINDEG